MALLHSTYQIAEVALRLAKIIWAVLVLDRLVGLNGDILGGAGGEEKHVLITAELPSHIHTAPSHVHINPAHQHYTSATTSMVLTAFSHMPGFVMTGAAGEIELVQGIH